MGRRAASVSLFLILLAAAWSVSIAGAVAARRSPATPGPQKAALPARFKAWLDDEVAYIISPAERDIFLKLDGDADRDRFAEEFWRQRDPTKGTPRNEFRIEHDRRLAYADKVFGRGTPGKGRRTPQGRIYIILGPPVDVQKFESWDTYPIELWTYQGNPALGQAPFFRLLFYKKGGGGDFALYHPLANSPKELVAGFASDSDARALKALADVSAELAEATMSLVPGARGPGMAVKSGILLAEVQSYPHKIVKPDYALAILEHRPTVEVSYSVHFIGNQFAIALFRDASGGAFLSYALVPERISFDSYEDARVAGLTTTLRLTGARGETIYQKEASTALELHKNELAGLLKSSFHLYGAVPVIPGSWTLHILLENSVSREFTTVERPIIVPAEDESGLSPLVLARSAEQVEDEGAARRPFQVGGYRIHPSVNNVFAAGENVFAFFQLYGAAVESAASVEFAFLKDGAPVRSVRQDLDAAARSRNILAGLSTAGLAAGDYRLRASVKDRGGRAFLAALADLRLAAGPLPAAWIVTDAAPAPGEAATDLALGTQYLNAGDLEAALDCLSRARLKAGDSVEILNALGDCHLRRGDKARALEAYGKSLELLPAQDKIRKIVSEIK